MGSQDLQTGRYDQLIRRVGGLYGGGSKVVEALPELFPVLELENTTPELIALSGWRTAWQSTERPAMLGVASASQLRNPAGSGVLITVTELVLRVTPDTNIQCETSNVLFGTPVPGLFRDARFGIPRGTAGQVASVDNVAVGGGLRIRLQDGVPFVLRDDNGIVVLAPGTNLDVGTTGPDILLTVNYLWRERIALDSEINFP